MRLAVERQHEVTALVRQDSAFTPPPGIDIRIVDVTDQTVLDGAVTRQDAVLCCLGLRRAGRSPWAPLSSPPDLMQRVARDLAGVMRHQHVPRVIAVSADGVADSFEQLTWPVKLLVSAGNIAVAYRDLAAMEAVLGDSGRDWLVVRPVTLTDGPPTGRGRPVRRYRLTSTHQTLRGRRLDARCRGAPGSPRTEACAAR